MRVGRSGRGREDRGKIYLAKTTRALAYGALSAFLLLYLTGDLHFSVLSSLVLTALSLVGAAVWSLVGLPPVEARLGRRRALFLFSGLFVASAALLYLSSSPWAVLTAVVLGGVSAATADNGPLASLDQAILPSTLRRADRAHGFAWYNLLAYIASSVGALLLVVPGSLDPQQIPVLPPAPHPWIALVYLLLAAATAFAYLNLSPGVDAPAKAENPGRPESRLSPESQRNVRDLAALSAVDAFAGGLVINPLIAAYFVLAWHADAAEVGTILFLSGIVAAASFLAAGGLARRFGLLNTMVFSHLPSNVMLALIPVMPSFALAVGMLVARSSLSQLDVPTRQAYSMSLVAARERTAAAGMLSGSRALGQSVGPFPATFLENAGVLAAPFFLAGGLKVAYDLLIWRRFRRLPLPEEESDVDGGRRGPTSPGDLPPG